MSNKLNLTRGQIAAIVGNDPDAIRRFEELFEEVGQKFPDSMESIELSLATISSKNGNILDLMSKISNSLEMIAKKPSEIDSSKHEDQLLPVQIHPNDEMVQKEVYALFHFASGTFNRLNAFAINSFTVINSNGIDITTANTLKIEQDGLYEIVLNTNIKNTSLFDTTSKLVYLSSIFKGSTQLERIYRWFNSGEYDSDSKTIRVRLEKDDLITFKTNDRGNFIETQGGVYYHSPCSIVKIGET